MSGFQKGEYLAPLKGQSKQQIRFITFDIEAHQWTKHICNAIYDGHSEYYKQYESIFEMLIDMQVYCYQKDIRYIFVHNGGRYDFNFIINEVLAVDCEKHFRLGDLIDRGSGLLSMQVFPKKGSKYFKNMPDKFFEKSLYFTDSIALLPSSLRKLGKSFNVKTVKEEIDYEHLKKIWDNKNYVDNLLKETSDKITPTKILGFFKAFKKDKMITNNLEKVDKLIGSKRRYIVFNGDKILTRTVKNAEKIFYYDVLRSEKHNKIYNREDLEAYLKADCISLWEIIHKFYTWPLIKCAGPKTTIAAQALNVFRRYLSSKIRSLSTNVDDFVRKGYFGGRTEVFRPVFDCEYNSKKNELGFNKKQLKIMEKFKEYKNLAVLDVNSLYPFVMAQNEFPTDFINFTCEYKKDSMAMWKAKVRVPKNCKIPPLPKVHDVKVEGTDKTERKLIFPTGDFWGYFTTVELNFAIENCGVKILEIEQGALFKNAGYLFKDYIEEMYNTRLQAKREGDGTTSLIVKLLMNSTYGKMGQRRDRESIELDRDGNEEGVDEHSYINTKEGEQYVFIKRPVTLKSFSNSMIAAYVTAYARVHLLKQLLRAGHEHVFYADTDSIFTTKPEVFDTGDELGKLKLEYTSKSAIFLLAKTYFMNKCEGEDFMTKIAMKGFPKDKAKNFNFEDFRLALMNEKDSGLKIEQEPKFATLKTALRNGQILFMDNDIEFKKKSHMEKEETFHLVKERRKIKFEKLKKKKQVELTPKEYEDWYSEHKDDFKKWCKTHKGKYVKKEYKKSYSAIKSKYNKMVLDMDNLTTIPHHIME